MICMCDLHTNVKSETLHDVYCIAPQIELGVQAVNWNVYVNSDFQSKDKDEQDEPVKDIHHDNEPWLFHQELGTHVHSIEQCIEVPSKQ